MSETRNAHLTADLVLIGEPPGGERHVLLIARRWPPYQGWWALPGGYVDQGEPFAQAARRELAEETNLAVREPMQVGIYDAPDRDPRGRVVSVAFTATVPGLPAPTAGDDARVARWVPLVEVLADPDQLAFDHAEILRDALARLDTAATAGRHGHHGAEEETLLALRRADGQELCDDEVNYAHVDDAETAWHLAAQVAEDGEGPIRFELVRMTVEVLEARTVGNLPPCGQYVAPASMTWVDVVVRNTAPGGDLYLRRCVDQDEADAVIAAWPERFHLYLSSDRDLVEVERSNLTTKPGARTYGDCRSCGRSYYRHVLQPERPVGGEVA